MRWNLEEAHLRQERTTVSAANADAVNSPTPPERKYWAIIGVSYQPSVAETQTVSFAKVLVGVAAFGLLNPISLPLNPHFATCLEQGTELLLFPGEVIYAYRGAHTAGSTMTLVIQFVEMDLPLYVYEEPQVVKRRHLITGQVKDSVGEGRVTIQGGGYSPERRGGGTLPRLK